MQELFETTGRFGTVNAQKYLVQLCKHFGHKVPAEADGNLGRVTFERGEARLTAHDDELQAILTSPDKDAIARLQFVIDDHLKRFAFREDCTGMDWTPTA